MPTIQLTKQETAINFNNEILNLFNLGQKRLLVSILWIQTLIESDEDQFKKDVNQPYSWMYLRFNSITNLDPNFLEAYQYGGQYLSIIKDDDWGALEIFTKGIKYYPNDYFLNYNLGYHYYFELSDIKNSIYYFDKIKENPRSPDFIPSLIARLKAESGNLEIAYQLILENYNKTPKNNQLSAHLEESLYNIRTELDLKCLNNAQINCNRNDLYGNPYLKNSKNEFISQKNWKPFRIYKNNKS